MDTNIATTTEKEVQDIISALIDRGFNRWDEAWVEIETPFVVNPDGRNEKKAGFVLYPELLTYSTRTQWQTVPWICVRAELQHHHTIDDSFERKFVLWLRDELEAAGYKAFKDEDAFAGCCTRVEEKGSTKFKLYVNPSYPDGYWSNHTL